MSTEKIRHLYDVQRVMIIETVTSMHVCVGSSYLCFFYSAMAPCYSYCWSISKYT